MVTASGRNIMRSSRPGEDARQASPPLKLSRASIVMLLRANSLNKVMSRFYCRFPGVVLAAVSVSAAFTLRAGDPAGSATNRIAIKAGHLLAKDTTLPKDFLRANMDLSVD